MRVEREAVAAYALHRRKEEEDGSMGAEGRESKKKKKKAVTNPRAVDRACRPCPPSGHTLDCGCAKYDISLECLPTAVVRGEVPLSPPRPLEFPFLRPKGEGRCKNNLPPPKTEDDENARVAFAYEPERRVRTINTKSRFGLASHATLRSPFRPTRGSALSQTLDPRGGIVRPDFSW